MRLPFIIIHHRCGCKLPAVVIFLTLIILTGCTAGAQLTDGIKNIYAFRAEHLPGIVAVDPQGNPTHQGPDTLYTIYIESAKPIQWLKAWKNGKTYSIIAMRIADAPVDAGIKKANGEHVLINVTKGNALWRLDLTPAEKQAPPPQKIKAGHMLLQGTHGTKTVVRSVVNEVELKLPDAV